MKFHGLDRTRFCCFLFLWQQIFWRQIPSHAGKWLHGAGQQYSGIPRYKSAYEGKGERLERTSDGKNQGAAEDEFDNQAPFDFDVNEIDFMLLTHAHIDHSGRIPKLYNEGFRKPVYAHKATCDLCSLMLPDS